MELVQELVGRGNFSMLAAFMLGLLAALSPCPLATNITAIGYVGKDFNSPRRVFISGIVYALGRILAYFFLGHTGFFIKSGRDVYGIQKFVSSWGAFLLPIFLILSGLLILFAHRLKFASVKVGSTFCLKLRNGFLGAFLMGVVFALALCPSSAVLYFGILVPMSAKASVIGYILPAVFALATALPVLLASWFLAFSVGEIGKLYNSMAKFEVYFRKFVGVLFIAVGAYCIF